MKTTDELVAEAREALLRGPLYRVRESAVPGSVEAVNSEGVEFPKGSGLYAISAPDPSCLRDVTLDVTPCSCGLLYVGKAERSLAKRDVRQHFGTGKTGRSTVRRTFAALLVDKLGLTPVPVYGPAGTAAGPKTFVLDPESEAALTEWMTEHLALRVWTPPSDAVVLAAVERGVIAGLNPPLNLTHAGPRPRLKAARKAMVELAVESRYVR